MAEIDCQTWPSTQNSIGIGSNNFRATNIGVGFYSNTTTDSISTIIILSSPIVKSIVADSLFMINLFLENLEFISTDEYSHRQKIPPSTARHADGSLERISTVEVDLNWQSENALA